MAPGPRRPDGLAVRRNGRTAAGRRAAATAATRVRLDQRSWVRNSLNINRTQYRGAASAPWLLSVERTSAARIRFANRAQSDAATGTRAGSADAIAAWGCVAGCRPRPADSSTGDPCPEGEVSRSAGLRPRPQDHPVLLMPSTRFAYPQVVWRTFASFRVVNSDVSSVQRDFCSGFDSRQLHREFTGQSQNFWPVFLFSNFSSTSVG